MFSFSPLRVIGTGESLGSVAERAEPYGLGYFRICLLPWILGDDAGTRQSDWGRVCLHAWLGFLTVRLRKRVGGDWLSWGQYYIHYNIFLIIG